MKTARRSNWRNEEIHNAGNGKGIFFIWGGLLVLDAQDPNVEWCTKVSAAVQDASQCYCAIYSERKKTLPRHHWIFFSRMLIELSPARNQNLCHQCQVWVKLQLASLSCCCWAFSSTSPTSSTSSSQELFLLVRSVPAPGCQLLYYTTIHFKVLYWKIKNVYYCVWFYALYLWKVL